LHPKGEFAEVNYLSIWESMSGDIIPGLIRKGKNAKDHSTVRERFGAKLILYPSKIGP
jgi:hypothetical protein